VGQNVDRVWITDFGLARAADSVTLTRTGVIAGTPHYMSPEQARGETIDQRSDLFSLGCVLYFLCVGKPPFDAENTLAVLHKIVSQKAQPLPSLRDDLPPSFVSLVHRLLERSADRRPRDCEVVIEMLEQAHTEHQAGRKARRLPCLRSHRRSLAMAIGFLLTLGIVAAALQHRSMPNFVSRVQPAVESFTSPSSVFPTGSGIAIEVDPYIVRAAVKIESVAEIDSSQFANRIERVHRDLSNFEQRFPFQPIDVMSLGDSDWENAIAELNQKLQ
jgi:serine/threonine protein kinase